MILEGPVWSQILKAVLALAFIGAFFAFVKYRKDGEWFWKKRQ